MVLDEILAHTPEESDSRRSSVQLGSFPFIDKVPVSRGCRVYGSRFEDGGSDAIGKGTVDDISVSGDPPDIRHTGETVSGVHVEYVLDREQSLQDVPAGRVNYTFGLSGRSRCLCQLRADIHSHRG